MQAEGAGELARCLCFSGWKTVKSDERLHMKNAPMFTAGFCVVNGAPWELLCQNLLPLLHSSAVCLVDTTYHQDDECIFMTSTSTWSCLHKPWLRSQMWTSYKTRKYSRTSFIVGRTSLSGRTVIRVGDGWVYCHLHSNLNYISLRVFIV